MIKKLIFYFILIITLYGCIELLSKCGLILLNRYQHLDYYPTDIITEGHANIYDKLSISDNNYIIYSPSLGWSIKPNGFSKLLQANSAGFRANRNYSKSPGKGIRRILAYGDSYTHCDDVSNSETWQSFMEESNADLEVLNFGVGAFGLDQSFLRYIETERQYNSNIVLIGYMTENIARNVNTYRPFYVPMAGLPLTKPRFVIRDKKLALIPNYMQKLTDYRNLVNNSEIILSDLGANDYFFKKGYKSNIFDWSPTIRMIKILNRVVKLKLYDDVINKDGKYNESSEAYKVTVKLLDEFYNRVIRNNSIPVIIIFPNNKDVVRYQRNQDKQYLPLIRYLDSKGYDYIDIMDAIENHDIEQLFAGHYTPFANELVASFILNYINNHPLDSTQH